MSTDNDMDLFGDLAIGGEELRSSVDVDDALIELTQMSDYEFNGTSVFRVPSMIPPTEFKIGLIVGGSGTGKSSLLRHFGEASEFEWDRNKAVASQVDYRSLMRMGLSSVPSLCRPYHILSTGERHRAEIARAVLEDHPVIDEFTSVVNRDLAKSICMSLRKFADNTEGFRLVLATCHFDVVDWLQPDWVFNTNTGKLVEGRSERRPSINLEIHPCTSEIWPIFRPHHYLSGDMNKSSRCWVATINNQPVAFYASLPLPHPSMKNAWRGHRCVVLPDYQGMGIGSILSERVASYHVNDGRRFFAKTAHIALGEHRERSPLWRATKKNKRKRWDYQSSNANKKYSHDFLMRHKDRVCYSHEFIGSLT